MAVVFNSMRVIDMPSAHQPSQVGEDQTVLADGDRQRISSARIAVRDEDISTVGKPEAEQFRSGVGEVGADRSGPGTSLIFRNGTIEKLAAPIVAEQGDEPIVGQRPPDAQARVRSG